MDCYGGGIVTESSSHYVCFYCDFSGCLKCGENPPGTCDGFDKDEKERVDVLMKKAQKEGRSDSDHANGAANLSIEMM